MYKLELVGSEVPAKKNSRITLKNGKTIPSARYKAWHEEAVLQLRSKVKECIEDKCYVILVFTHGDNIRRDSDNGVSSVFDTLQDVQQLADDRWQIVRSHHVFNNFDKGNPKCEIYIFKSEEKKCYIEVLSQCLEFYS